MSKKTFSASVFRANMNKFEKEYEGMVSLKEERSSTKEQSVNPTTETGRTKSINDLTDREYLALYGGDE